MDGKRHFAGSLGGSAEVQHVTIVDRQSFAISKLDKRSTVWTRYAGSAEMQHLATQLVEIAQLIH